MSYNLLIVESPHKADTIKDFLDGNGKWIIVATKGHVRDLPKKRYGLTKTNSGYSAEEEFISGEKKDIINEIAKLSASALETYIGADMDREGEKISHDVVEFAKIKKYKRVTFTSITKDEVLKSLLNARLIDERIVNAQRSRRYIDRFGYKLSNIITWSLSKSGSLKDGQSVGIGRVICPALKLIVDNERARRSFVPEQYFQVSVKYQTKDKEEFNLVLDRRFTPEQKNEIEDVISTLRSNLHIVTSYEEKLKEVSPPPPLSTATLQRAAFYGANMGFRPSYTMELAQKLYESGFITYHRLDGVNLSEEAIVKIITTLQLAFPLKDIAYKGRKYKSKKGAKEAHEAIRPCFFEQQYFPKKVTSHPSWIKSNLREDHQKLYNLIWYRTMMTQMADAIYKSSILEIKCKEIKLRGIASYIDIDENGEDKLGWLKVNRDILRTSDPEYLKKDRFIPRVNIGESLKVDDKNVERIERFTEKPDRYGLGRFQTVLEDKNIGRPSTFASIPDSLVKKGYCKDNSGFLEAEPLGEMVVEWCEKHQAAHWLINLEHASDFEDMLDKIEEGEMEPDSLISEYDELLEKLKAETGYKEKDEMEPSEAMKKMVENIAKHKGAILSGDIYSNYAKASAYIKANVEQYEKLGACPICKNDVTFRESSNKETGEIFAYYACSKKECKFKIYDSAVERFFGNFKRFTDKEERVIIMKGVLRKKSGYEVGGLKKRDNTEFSANIRLKQDEKYGWQVELMR